MVDSHITMEKKEALKKNCTQTVQQSKVVEIAHCNLEKWAHDNNNFVTRHVTNLRYLTFRSNAM